MVRKLGERGARTRVANFYPRLIFGAGWRWQAFQDALWWYSSLEVTTFRSAVALLGEFESEGQQCHWRRTWGEAVLRAPPNMILCDGYLRAKNLSTVTLYFSNRKHHESWVSFSSPRSQEPHQQDLCLKVKMETDLDALSIPTCQLPGLAAVKYADLHNNRYVYLVRHSENVPLDSTNCSHNTGSQTTRSRTTACLTWRSVCLYHTWHRKTSDRVSCRQGNTAVYLLYTHARVSSILDRAGDTNFASFDVEDVVSFFNIFWFPANF